MLFVYSNKRKEEFENTRVHHFYEQPKKHPK